MNSQQAKQIIRGFPSSPGVYIFKKSDSILYIGKATSLRDRVRSYFNPDIVKTRSLLVSKMLGHFDKIDYIKTDSILEALVLEAHLIKKHQPEANIQEKDNKSFNFVVITKEDFPRVLVARGRELLQSHFAKDKEYDIAYSFGPFPNSSQLKEAMKIVRKLFPFRDTCVPFDEQMKKNMNKYPSKNTSRDAEFFSHAKGVGQIRECFNSQIGLCPGVCTGEISKEKYRERIQNIILFFEGNKKRVIKNLEKEMSLYAKRHEFEKAGEVKKTLFTLSHIQDISLIKEDALRQAQGENKISGFRIESYDIAHMSGKNMVGVMTVVLDGEVKKSDYRKFKIKDNSGANDTKSLREVLTRRLAHIEWPFADLVVVDGGIAQKRTMEKVLRENRLRIPVVSVVKDERHRPKAILGDKKYLQYEREIILSNSEAHRYGIAFHKHLRGKI